MANIRVMISSDSITETEFTPIWLGEIEIDLERDQIFYREKMRSELLFKGNDFSILDGVDECERINVRIDHYCLAWGEIFSGYFTKKNIKPDYDRCEGRVTAATDDDYTCILENWTEENIIYSASDVTPAIAFAGEYEAGLGCCSTCYASYNPTPCNDFNVTTACAEYTTVTQPASGFCAGQFLTSTCYHRVVGVGTPSTPPTYGTGWTYISGSNWWRCPTFAEISGGKLLYGRIFNNVITYLVGLLPCELTVRSHFFNINATHAAAPTNDAYTYAENYLQNITIHQKSDVKRPDSTNPSFSRVWLMKLNELLNDLREMFNVYWKIDGADLILEHISYFESATGADYTGRDIAQQLSEVEEDAPKKETFDWMDNAVFGTMHEGYPILYDCGEGIKAHRVVNFTNDIDTCKESENAEDIADKGFVLVSNTKIGTDYFINELNEPMGWVMLHENLHRHNRFAESGTMNDNPTTFETVKPYRKLKEFTAPFCCADTFDPTLKPVTELGEGKVVRATINHTRDTIKLQLLYP